jgi:hypothetical protein
MVSHAQLSPSPSSPSWSRTHSNVENPFQNSTGPFIYALPDLRSFRSPHTAMSRSRDDPATSFEVLNDKRKEPPHWDESHFDPDIGFYLAQGEVALNEVNGELRLRAKQEDNSPTPTPTSSVPSSPASSESASVREKLEGEKKPKRTRRRRRRNRYPLGNEGCVMGPRSMNPYGTHLLPWTYLAGSYSVGSAYRGTASSHMGPWLLQPPVSRCFGLFSS